MDVLFLPSFQLKTERELDRIKGLKLVELWLERNPLCDYFKDQASYIRSVCAQDGWVGNGRLLTVCWVGG